MRGPLNDHADQYDLDEDDNCNRPLLGSPMYLVPRITCRNFVGALSGSAYAGGRGTSTMLLPAQSVRTPPGWMTITLMFHFGSSSFCRPSEKPSSAADEY